jgi:hypothetical protein
MPSRFVSLVIVLGWLGMGAWLFARDLWPRWRPGEPPKYTFMVSDEVPREGVPIRWKIFHNGSQDYDMEAKTVYQEKGPEPADRDTFLMKAIVKVKQQPRDKAPLRRLRSFLRVARGSGELHQINAQLHIAVGDWECLFDVAGRLSEGELLPRWRIRVYPADDETEDRVFDRPRTYKQAMLRELDVPFQPVELAGRGVVLSGIVLNPFHPPNRLDELSPGQDWRMPLVGNLLVLESLGKALHGFFKNPRLEDMTNLVGSTLGPALDDVPVLAARVLPQPEQLPNPLGESDHGGESPACWVIEAADDAGRIHARLWIQQSDGKRKGLVLRQDVNLKTETSAEEWIVQRELSD